MGELHPLHITIKKVFKKMDKKMYFEPEMEVIDLMLQGMLCASDIDDEGGEANLDPTEGGQDDFPNQD